MQGLIKILVYSFFVFLVACDSSKDENSQPSGNSDPDTNQNQGEEGGVDGGDSDEQLNCGIIQNGEKETRIRYRLESVAFNESCETPQNKETQERTCAEGQFSPWSGSFTYTNCIIQGNNDFDNDGINNDLDNCPNHSNSDQRDIDDNGIGDVCDPKFLAKVNILLND